MLRNTADRKTHKQSYKHQYMSYIEDFPPSTIDNRDYSKAKPTAITLAVKKSDSIKLGNISAR